MVSITHTIPLRSTRPARCRYNLTEMLEGQVAVLSSGKLDSQEVVDLCAVLKKSRLFREDQYSYILYPDKELPHFCEKNTFFAAEAEKSRSLRK